MIRLFLTMAVMVAVLGGCAGGGQRKVSSVAEGRFSSMSPGTWTGWIKPQNEAASQVTYDVRVRGSTIAISIKGPGGQRFTFRDVKLDADSLTFVWPFERCALTRKPDGTFEGDCALPDGSDRAHMVMVPPRN